MKKLLLLFLLTPILCFSQWENNLVSNPDFETLFSTYWGKYNLEGADSVITRNNIVQHGDSSVYISVDAASEGFFGNFPGSQFAIISGRTYRFRAWHYYKAGTYQFNNLGGSNFVFSTPVSSGSQVWVRIVKEVVAIGTGNQRIVFQSLGAGGADCYIDNIEVRERIDTLWTSTAKANDTDNDTTKTLSEAFVTRGSHIRGTFITLAGTYSESITIDSSFTKWEASGGNVAITQVDFNSVTCSVDYNIYNNIGVVLNAGNVTLFNVPEMDNPVYNKTFFPEDIVFPAWPD